MAIIHCLKPQNLSLCVQNSQNSPSSITHDRRITRAGISFDIDGRIHSEIPELVVACEALPKMCTVVPRM